MRARCARKHKLRAADDLHEHGSDAVETGHPEAGDRDSGGKDNG